MLRGGLLVLYPLSKVASSAADRSTLCLLNGVVGDGPRVHSTSTSRRAGRGDRRFLYSIKKRNSNQEGGPLVLRGGLLINYPLPEVDGSAAVRSTFFFA